MVPNEQTVNLYPSNCLVEGTLGDWKTQRWRPNNLWVRRVVDRELTQCRPGIPVTVCSQLVPGSVLLAHCMVRMVRAAVSVARLCPHCSMLESVQAAEVHVARAPILQVRDSGASWGH